MANELYTDLDNLERLNVTDFSQIPIEGLSTPEEIEAYEKNPLVARQLRWQLKIDKSELNETLIQAAGEEAEKMREALINGDTDAIRGLVEFESVLENFRRQKFLELVQPDGTISTEHLADVTFGKPIIFKISRIRPAYIYGDMDIELNKYPSVALNGVDRPISSIIPAAYMPIMWMDDYGFINQLEIIGRYNDLPQVKGEVNES